MKKIFHPLALLGCLGIATLSACDKRLDVTPISSIPAETAINNSTDVEALLKGAYELSGDQYLYGGGFQYYLPGITDNL